MKIKIIVLSTLLMLIITYIGWIFYMSEPKYIDNPEYNQPEKFDIVSIRYAYLNSRLVIGIVVQIDSSTYHNHSYALVKVIDGAEGFYDVEINTITPAYKIIGRGTFYHKVNHFAGFNIIMITTVLIIILGIVVLVVLIGCVRDMLGLDPIFD